MTEKDFRVMHSQIIEQYQLIEMHLRGICAAFMANEDKDWYKCLKDYEIDPLRVLSNKLEKLQEQYNKFLLTKDDFKTMKEIRDARNYWVHQCFLGSTPICFPKGEVKNPGDAEHLRVDYQNAVEWEKIITEIFRANTERR